MSFIRKYKRGNRIYLAEVESYRSDGKIKQRFIRYLGTSPESKESDPTFKIKDIEIESVKVYGPVIALESIARELGLFELLGDIAEPILTLVFAHCMDYKSIKETEQWFEKTDLGSVFNCQKISKNRLYNAVSKLSEINTEWLQESIFENLTSILGVDDSGCIYDGTNTHLTGSSSKLAKKGKDKEGVRGRKLIQIGLGVTREKGLPIFHQVHAGNVHDTKMFEEAINSFSMKGVSRGLMVFDRGISSTKNILKLSARGWRSLAGVRMHQGIKSSISNMDFEKMQTFRNLVIQGETEFYVKSLEHEIGGYPGKLLILLNPEKRQRLTTQRRRKIEKAKNEKKSIDTDISKYLNCDGKINHHAVSRAERYDGISVLFTNAKLSLKESVSHYFAKDIVERCFRLEKSALYLNPIRLSLDENIKSHILICYLALVLLTTVRIRTENKGIFADPSTTLSKLESIYKVYLVGTPKQKNGKKFEKVPFSKLNTMTNHQTDILKAIAPKLEM